MKIFTFALCVSLLCAFNLHAQTFDGARADFKKADSIAELYPHHSLKDLRLLSYRLTRSLSTEKEKFRALYMWVCNNIGYDMSLYRANEKNKRKYYGDELNAWNKRFSALVFTNLVKKQSTVCTGYAYLLRELCLHAGISCSIVDGYCRTSGSNVRGNGSINHSWNTVKLDDRWYLCDPTWSSGVYDAETGAFIRQFNESYFLTDPAMFIMNHYPADTSFTLLANNPSLAQFLQSPLVYSSALQYLVQPRFPATLDVAAHKGEQVSFRFSVPQANAGNMVLYIPALGAGNARQSIVSEGNGLYSVTHTFASKGIYAVHVLVENTYVVSYEVRVR